MLDIARKLELDLAQGPYHCQPDLLAGIDDEDTSNGKRDALLINVGSILGVNHIVRPGDFALRIRYDGELEVRLRRLVDVFYPLVVGREVVCGLQKSGRSEWVRNRDLPVR